MPDQDSPFSRLVSLACHDLRTPLATVHGFALTLARMESVGEPMARYVELIRAGSVQLTELLDDLALAARIEGGRWEPQLETVETIELAEAARGRLDEGAVRVDGHGGRVLADRDAAGRAVCNLARCAIRHGGLDRLDLRAEVTALVMAPVGEDVAPILLGEDLRDFGAAVARRVIEALGGSLDPDRRALLVRFPAAPAAQSVSSGVFPFGT
jgi:hypothetical protein